MLASVPTFVYHRCSPLLGFGGEVWVREWETRKTFITRIVENLLISRETK